VILYRSFSVQTDVLEVSPTSTGWVSVRPRQRMNDQNFHRRGNITQRDFRVNNIFERK